MPKFLVESYLPRSADALEEASAQASRAAALARGDGASFQHVRTTLVRADETCFHMFLADSIEDVEAALARVGLTADRIVQAVETKTNNAEGGTT
jgi:hypothetical protein